MQHSKTPRWSQVLDCALSSAMEDKGITNILLGDMTKLVKAYLGEKREAARAETQGRDDEDDAGDQPLPPHSRNNLNKTSWQAEKLA